MRREVRRPWLRYLSTVLVVLGLLIGAQQAQAGNSDEGGGADLTVEPFAADSGDVCGTTSGQLEWKGGEKVTIKGEVVDWAPVPGTATSGCGGLATTVTFTVYIGSGGGSQVRTTQVDNGELGFVWVVSEEDPDSTPPIDRVVVKVCRRPPGSGSGGYCGTARIYRPPTP